MKRVLLLPLLATALAGCTTGDSTDESADALRAAKAAALKVISTSDERPNNPTVEGARRDGACFAVRVGGGTGAEKLVVLRRPPEGEGSVVDGFEALGIRDDRLGRLDGNKADCGFS